MNQILILFSIIAGIGFLLSLIVHVLALMGKNIPYASMVWYLHIGIFVVWIPAILVASRTTKDFKQKDFWKAALRGCPPWMKHLFYFFGGYAVINFLLFIYLERSGTGDGGNELIKLRGFSGHWMAFYSAAMATLYSATQIEKHDKQRRCLNGHLVSPLGKFCEECGASVLDLNIK